MKDEIKKWVVNWFKERNQDPELVIGVESDYYKCGLLDSFGIIELIEEVEAHFSLRFDDSDFQSVHFRTIQGLVQIIEQKIGEAN